jgi:hypothetical protein
MLEHETLTRVDDDTRRELTEAAAAYVQAPVRLREAIVNAGRAGERPADIVKAIGHAMTYDYVARLVREDRAQREVRETVEGMAGNLDERLSAPPKFTEQAGS